jgi:alkanesulfonate monooxygenase SsuD/methylene tetrahydromethanopterin reductase-like flavin-dependent oxidoreductase (luciferase family)
VTTAVLAEQVGQYQTALDAGGHPPPTELPLMREAWLADTSDQAWAEAAPFLARKYAVYNTWGQDRALPADQTFDRPLAELGHDRFIVGTPDDLVAMSARYAAELGVNTLILRIQWPGMSQPQVLDQIRLIGQAVIPRLASIEPQPIAHSLKS